MLNDGDGIVVIDVREQHEYDAGCFEEHPSEQSHH